MSISEDFMDLHDCLFETQHEIDRFRQVPINSVLATDIMDKELNGLRRKRWDKSFSSADDVHDGYNHSKRDLRATIVIEHIIQASDVSHTMQHWLEYRKRNKLLFQELYVAYQTGRMNSNPCVRVRVRVRV